MDKLAGNGAIRRDGGRRVVLTNGWFDGWHASNAQCLRQAREHGDLLIVVRRSGVRR